MPAPAPGRVARAVHRRSVLARLPGLRTPLLAVLVLVALARVAAVVAGTVFSYQLVDASGPAKLWGKAVGDLDGDGLVDLAAGGYLGGLYWYKNPTWKKSVISATARIEEDLEIVDLDQDGRNDVVSITYGGVTWFRNTGSGWAPQTLISGQDLHDIDVKDLDGDGKLDIAGRDQMPRGDRLFLWRQQSPTSWVPSSIPLPEVGTGLLAVDLDRDGKPDLAIGKYWFKNNSSPGALSFMRYTYNTGAEQDAYVAAGRINADKYVDLVVTPAHKQSGTHKVAWYQAPATTTAGWKQRVLVANAEPQYHFAMVTDFDGDGRNDIATALTHLATNPRIEIFYNTGDAGTAAFGAPVTVDNKSSHSMKLIDVGGTGNKSLVGADYGDSGKTPIELWRASGVSPAPVAVADSAATAANTAVKIGVLANDSGTGLAVSAVTVPANGTAAINADQTVSYTPGTGYTGTDSFQYTITDSASRTASATVTVTVRNAAPVAGDDVATTPAGSAVSIAVLANDSDPDGHALTISAVSDPPKGTATINAAKTAITYTPDSGFSGTDSFSYTASDGRGGTDTATVSVTVTAVEPPAPVYLGCFKDQSVRDIDGLRTDDTVGMTVNKCASTCRAGGFPYFGVQAGKACFCGIDYNSYGTANNCNMACSGDSSQICGGSWANSVYRLP